MRDPVDEPPAPGRGNVLDRRGLGHRLSRRHGPSTASSSPTGAIVRVTPRQQRALRRGSDRLGRAGLGLLRAGRRRDPGGIGDDRRAIHPATAAGASCRHCRSLSLALRLLPRAVPDRPQDSCPTAIAQPPYRPVFDVERRLRLLRASSISRTSTTTLARRRSSIFGNAYRRVRIAGISTLLLLLVGYPIAYGMARAPARSRPLLVMLVILPFWTSFLIRIYAWIGILKPEGLLNQVLHGARPDRRAARHPQHRDGGLSSASSMPICRSWCCRSTRRWRRWTTR